MVISMYRGYRLNDNSDNIVTDCRHSDPISYAIISCHGYRVIAFYRRNDKQR